MTKGASRLRSGWQCGRDRARRRPFARNRLPATIERAPGNI